MPNAFDQLAAAHQLTVLSQAQRAAAMRAISSSGQTHCRRIAFDREEALLLVEDGNLEHYGGLEYDTPLERHQVGASVVTLYRGTWDADGEPEETARRSSTRAVTRAATRRPAPADRGGASVARAQDLTQPAVGVPNAAHQPREVQGVPLAIGRDDRVLV